MNWLWVGLFAHFDDTSLGLLPHSSPLVQWSNPKLCGATGELVDRKHAVVSEIRHIGKESDNLTEPFGLDEYSYEFYDDPERVSREFKENVDRILDL